jgi:hypothetical protein
MHELAPLCPLVREHLELLTDHLGIRQHATGIEPDPAHGTCTDDVARAVLVDLDHAEVLGPSAVEKSLRRSIRYLVEALDTETGRFRNFRATDGTWLGRIGSEDCHGRAMLALAGAASRSRTPEVRRISGDLLLLAAPAALRLTALRALASATLACAEPLDARTGTALRPVLVDLSGRLESAFSGTTRTAVWPWPEECVTYESALPARALIAVGSRIGKASMTDLGLATLDWLLRGQLDADGRFDPVGNRGWWPTGGPKAPFDQQPIEAGSVVKAAESAFEVTGDRRYVEAAERAYAWFLGANRLGLTIADPARGGCRDGLGADGVNPNQGAESTLSWLTALETIRRIRRLPVNRPDRRPGGGEVGDTYQRSPESV